MNIPHIISQRLNIPMKGVEATISLLDQGATIPFISRYRKEATGSLDEVAVFDIQQTLAALRNLEKRKSTVIESIENQGLMTDELRKQIDETDELTVLEDIYLPFKPKKRTRASVAREHGLEPLAKIIMSRSLSSPIEQVASRFIGKEIETTDQAIAGASDIIAEWISENIRVRNIVRNLFARQAMIVSTVLKGKEEEGSNYQQYFDFSEPLRRCSSHRYLAMRRGENEGILKISLKVDDASAIASITGLLVKDWMRPDVKELTVHSATDSYKRLIRPAIETEISSLAGDDAEKVAIRAFADNVEQLLMAPPLGSKRVLAIDPGFRTGCKVVCLDEQGNLLHNDVIYPVPPVSDVKGAARKLSRLIESYRIDAISLGNGTASRETEQFLKKMIFPRKVEIYVVNENGASVYSASKIARDEFPDKDVTVRGAVSIGRRLIDPLAELVKIDPKSIGVGQYQHDVNQTNLQTALDNTVTNCVNRVGVNVNTASPKLLSYVSGIGLVLAENIIRYRTENGDFKSRDEFKKVNRLGEKAFQQCAAFLRIPGAANPLDNSAVHPESYHIVAKMAKDLNCTVNELTGNHEKAASIDINRYVTDSVGVPTLTDIISELKKPGRDPRKNIDVLEFDDNIRDINDVKPGMILNGIVNNITEFGAFIDLGIHQSGLLHISQMSDKRIASPRDVVKLNQHVRVRVLDVDLQRKRISLSLKDID